jgi:hypothetical protein
MLQLHRQAFAHAIEVGYIGERLQFAALRALAIARVN